MNVTRREFIQRSLGLGVGLGVLVANAYAKTTNPFSPYVGTQLPSQQAVNYAIVVSATTQTNSSWNKVVDALKEKYGKNIPVVTFKNNLKEAQSALREQQPTHVAYIAQPHEVALPLLASDERKQNIMQDFHAARKSGSGQFYTLLSSIDEDSYPDAIGGIITGKEATDALRLAEAQPLKVDYALFKTLATYVDIFLKSIGFSDGSKRADGNYIIRYERKKGITEESKVAVAGPEILKKLNEGNVDLLVTSCHANYAVWEPDFDRADDIFVATKQGDILVLDHADPSRRTIRGKINSPNPKVFFSPGCCQGGRIKDKDQSMTLAFMHTGGTIQHFGYNVDTWHGFMGWGLAETLFETTPSPTFFEALHMTRIAAEYSRQIMQATRKQQGLEGRVTDYIEEFGKIYDLYGFIGYGDPALDVRISRDPTIHAPFEKQMNIKKQKGKTVYTLTIKVNENKPVTRVQPVFLLPHRIKKPTQIKTSKKLEYAILDDAVIFDIGLKPIMESGQPKFEQVPLEQGESFSLQFTV